MPDNQPKTSGWITPKLRRSLRNKFLTTQVTESRRSTASADANPFQRLGEEPRDLLQSLTERAALEEIQFSSPQAARNQDHEDPESTNTPESDSE